MKGKMFDVDQIQEQIDALPMRTTSRAHKHQGRRAKLLAEALLETSEAEWAALSLDSQIVKMIDEWRRIPSKAHIARRRLTDRLSGHLQGLDLDAFEEALGFGEGATSAKDARLQGLDRWRLRILEEGDAAIDALVAECPDADRRRLRALRRQAIKDGAPEKASKAFREIFALLTSTLPA